MEITTPHGAILIRQAAEADAPAFRELRLQALRDHPVAFTADLAANLERPPSFWVKRISGLGADTMIYFAISGKTLVGMCGLHWETSPKVCHSGLIWGVYVQPEWRGQKVAEALIEACIGYGRARGISVFKLGVAATNAAAIRCYLHCGFQVYGVEPQAVFYEGVVYDELLMARRIG